MTIPEYVSFVGRDGTVYTETATSVMSQPLVYPHLPLWQRITRRLTPRRWRKPLQPVRNDPLARHQRFIESTLKAVEELTRRRPWWKFWA